MQFFGKQLIRVFSHQGKWLSTLVSSLDCLFLTARSIHPGNEGAVQRQPAAGGQYEDLGEQKEEQGARRSKCRGISRERGISRACLPLRQLHSTGAWILGRKVESFKYVHKSTWNMIDFISMKTWSGTWICLAVRWKLSPRSSWSWQEGKLT